MLPRLVANREIATMRHCSRYKLGSSALKPVNSIVQISKPTKTARVASAIRGFRLIPPIDRHPRVVLFVQTPLGKIALTGLFGIEFSFFHHDPLTASAWTLFLGLITLMPEYRRFILALAPVALAIVENVENPLVVGMTLSVVGLGLLLYWCAMLWPASSFGRRPILYLLSSVALLLATACWIQPKTIFSLVIWSFVGVVANYVWFIAYALTDRASKPASDLTLELTAFRPLWGSTDTPFPKGAAYLRRIEARTPQELAISQLKGLKLLAWAIILELISLAWNYVFHVYLQIPTSAQSLARSVQGIPVAWPLRWESTVLAFFESLLTISVIGHEFIAICRVAGFNALRNTYRPLSSTTLAEFFNRYYYYYKELIVDFFFYPAFFRYWKRRPRLRMIFATFAAACFGNFFFHFIRDWQMLRDQGLAKTISEDEGFAFYCVALATMLSISQLRKKRAKPAGILRGHILPAVGVCFLFSLLNIFVPETKTQRYALMDYFRYLASLFFIHL
jgi:hypothetical protein